MPWVSPILPIYSYFSCGVVAKFVVQIKSAENTGFFRICYRLQNHRLMVQVLVPLPSPPNAEAFGGLSYCICPRVMVSYLHYHRKHTIWRKERYEKNPCAVSCAQHDFYLCCLCKRHHQRQHIHPQFRNTCIQYPQL